MFVPGLLCDEAVWSSTLHALAHPAPTSISDVHTEPLSVAAMAEALLSGSPDRFALAGLSLGGYIALEVMRRAPERITRLALVDTNARADDPRSTSRRRAQLRLVGEDRFEEVVEQLVATFLAPARRHDEPLVARLAAMMRRTGPEVFARQQEAIIARADTRPLLPGITCPTLVLFGEEDALNPPAVRQELVDALPQAEAVVLSGTGHLAPLENPAATGAALHRWLT
ncbi:alpha/beta fold hydrolase [Kribbella shirazensis]|uniref:Pimeloyl-ACP methyl ester carboxylesterase n=1 Tax=Kribbella shirazensis TaxID=1105143 RepID=A0A7X5ZZJ2_9ACTN|nr:alpha/beta hydrolase [Kribbella shirazensis]NIK55998.1 pimeloyl-ACP methyl ester carboxylesterase [Kribbella shirazensis]